MYPIINIAGRPIRADALLFIGAVWVWIWLSTRLARERKVREGSIDNLIFFSVLGAVIGGRLAYVAGSWSAYQDDLQAIFSLTPTAFNAVAGILLGALTAFAYGWYLELPLWHTLDALAVGGILALAIVSLAQFLSGIGYGEPTALPWAVYLWSEWRHPVQLYQMVLLLLIAMALWLRRQQCAHPGSLTALAVTSYGLTRLVFEPFRADTALLAGFRMMQVIGLGLALVGVWGLYHQMFAQRDIPASQSGSQEQFRPRKEPTYAKK